jgi:hypothetical protein
MDRAVQWWVGDWLLYGAHRFGGKFVEAARGVGLEEQTLKNCQWVARSIPQSRRRDSLRWSHHAEVASLPPEEADRWLDLADRDRLSVRALRAQVQEARTATLQEPSQDDMFEFTRFALALREVRDARLYEPTHLSMEDWAMERWMLTPDLVEFACTQWLSMMAPAIPALEALGRLEAALAAT